MFDPNKLLNQMLGAGGASQAQGAMGEVGGLLGSLLQQSVSGLQEGASAIEKQTGVGAKAEEMLKGATGKSAGDLLNQAKDIMGKNQMAAGATLGGLGMLLVGTRGGRGLIGDAAALGGLALVGGLAYKAFQNYQAGKPPAAQPARIPAPVDPAPAASPFGQTGDPAQDQGTALLIIRAMIAAAACDGAVDDRERARILGGLHQAGLEADSAKFLEEEFARPATIDELASSTGGAPELAMQVYTAARIAIEPDSLKEKAFLMNLAVALNLDDAALAHIEAAASGAAAA